MNKHNHWQYSCFRKALLGAVISLLLTACQVTQPLDSWTHPESEFGQMVHQSTIPQLQERMAAGTLTAEELTRFFLQQIEVKNPQLNAIITANANAVEIAKTLDQERKAGNTRGPLHGIPIIIKDNIETATMPTTAGSLALKDNHTHRDSPLITKLKNAGAIILAKANLSEWANMRSERSSSGWSAIGGQARNPHDLTRSPCGSSSGSGIAVAANLAVAAIGTETDGSIVCPASATGIVGIKPTVGLVSRRHIVPISHTQDTAGPMAKSVTDAAIILAVIQGEDKADSATLNLGYDFNTGLAPKNLNALKNKRIGVLYSRAAEHEQVAGIVRQALSVIQAQGATLVDGLKLAPYKNFGQDSYDVLLYEFKSDLNRYLSGLPNELNKLTLEKLIAFNQMLHTKEMPYFAQEIFELAQTKGPLSDQAYLDALANIGQATRKDGLDQLIQTHNLDAIVNVTLGPAWSIDLLHGDHSVALFSSYPAIAGYPHITLPMGNVHQMPVGLSFTGAALSEKALIEMAYSFEQALNLSR